MRVILSLLLLLVCGAHGLFAPDTNSKHVPAQTQKLHAKRPVRLVDEDELIGGMGLNSEKVNAPAPESPQTSSLLQEDEGGVEAEREEYVQAPGTEVLDLSSEAHTSVGQKTVMQNDGLGHMVGHNEQSSQHIKRGEKDELAKQVEAADTQIAQINGLLAMLKSEKAEDSEIATNVVKTEQAKLAEIDAKYDSKLHAMQAQWEDQLRAVKREGAVKAKSVRHEKEGLVESKSKEIDNEVTQLRAESEKQVEQMEAEISALEARKKEADSKAEAVYSHNRAAWKRKHTAELEAKGVRSQVEKTKSDLNAERAKLEELRKQESALKDRLKEEARQKILMAARVQNLHLREESVREKEEALAKSNANLQHDLGELKMTEEQGKSEFLRVSKDAQQAVVQSAETAKAKAQMQREHFEQDVLHKAQQEIAELKRQLAIKSARDTRIEQELLQQEQNVQAEKKEADDALNKAKWEKQEAEKQTQIELHDSQLQVNAIEDEALRKAAAIKEAARAQGMAEASAEAQQVHEQQEKRERELELEEREAGQLLEQFKDKAARKMEEDRTAFLKHLEEEKAQMQESLKADAKKEVEEAKKSEEMKLKNIEKELQERTHHVDETEKEISSLEHINASLKKQIADLEFQSAHVKEVLTSEQLNAPTQKDPLPLPELL